MTGVTCRTSCTTASAASGSSPAMTIRGQALRDNEASWSAQSKGRSRGHLPSMNMADLPAGCVKVNRPPCDGVIRSHLGAFVNYRHELDRIAVNGGTGCPPSVTEASTGPNQRDIAHSAARAEQCARTQVARSTLIAVDRASGRRDRRPPNVFRQGVVRLEQKIPVPVLGERSVCSGIGEELDVMLNPTPQLSALRFRVAWELPGCGQSRRHSSRHCAPTGSTPREVSPRTRRRRRSL
jgi:hypothetical protein